MIDRLNVALEGRYRIERELGAGGMATVYLADDLKHDRQVALKVLKPELAAVVGAERFLAEIKTTANLQHPHILPLFDSGEADGFLFYVMPYVEGESLRDRLERERQLPVEEAVAIARDMADALDYAHRQGVVHRDIKPANILLQEGRPQLTDFGIALAVAEAGEGRLTETGLSLGTPHYMSPEQASGERSVDARTDIYALGCVLYEMLAGQPPFPGGSAQAVLARILTGEPEPITRRTVPRNVAAAVARALEKLPADRFDSVSAFQEALGDASFRHTVGSLGTGRAGTGGGAARVGWAGSRPGSWIAAGLVGVLALVAGWALGSGGVDSEMAGQAGRVVRVPVDMRGVEFRPWHRTMFLSPDGSTIAVVASRDGGPIAIHVRRVAEGTFRALPGTEDGCCPSFSPDGNWIVFTASTSGDRALRKVALAGGQPVTIVPASMDLQPVVADWGADGMIAFSGANGLYEVSENGGDPILLVEGQSFLTRPQRLPGGRGIVASGVGLDAWVYEPGADSVRTLVPDGQDATYLASGHLAYRHPDGGLWAAPFDLDALELTGPARPVLDDLDGTYSVSKGGTLAYRTGSGASGLARLVVVPMGDAPPDTLPLESRTMWAATFSPDGSKIAFSADQASESHIFVYDTAVGDPIQFTFRRAWNGNPVWSPDGSRIAFHTHDGDFTETEVWVKPLDGSTPAEPLIAGDGRTLLGDWTPDHLLLYWIAGSGEILMRPVDDESGDEPLPEIRSGWQPRLAPDGDWLAYDSNESGEPEVYVRRFPDGTGQQRVSAGGGSDPRWSPDGDVLYYQRGWEARPTITAARVRTEPTFAVLGRDVVYEGAFRSYDVHPIEPNLLVTTDEPAPEGEDGSDPERWFLVFNWFTELRERFGEGDNR